MFFANDIICGLKTIMSYLPRLDGIRGLAILAVLLSHSEKFSRFFPGGGMGVDLFFVLSGYLITTILKEEYDQSGTISFRRFYGRRILRLYPALLSCVAMTGILIGLGLIKKNLVDYGRAAGLALLYLTNLISFDLTQPLRHTWSLSLEEQFYLFWPFFLGFFVLKCKCWGRIAWSLIFILIFSVIRNVLVNQPALFQDDHYKWFHLFTWPFTRSDSLMFGALLTFALDHPVCQNKKLMARASFFVIPATGFLFYLLLSPANNEGWIARFGLDLIALAAAILIGVAILSPAPNKHAMLARIKMLAIPLTGCLTFSWALLEKIPFSVCLAACIFLTVIGSLAVFFNQSKPQGLLQLFLQTPLMTWIGKRSYGIYLYHLPLFIVLEGRPLISGSKVWTDMGNFGLEVLLTFFIAWVSYKYLEIPCLKKKDQWFSKQQTIETSASIS